MGDHKQDWRDRIVGQRIVDIELTDSAGSDFVITTITLTNGVVLEFYGSADSAVLELVLPPRVIGKASPVPGVFEAR